MPTKRPRVPVYFPDEETRQAKQAEAIAMGFDSLSAYILHLLDIEPLKRGAPEGNKNRSAKKDK